MIYLARHPDDFRDTARIQKELELPRPFLRKILQELKNQGIVESVKGAKGGFRLKKKPQEIYLLRLMRIFQGNFRFTECLFRKKLCRNIENCPIRKHLAQAEHTLLKEMQGTTIQTLLETFDA